MDRSPPSAASRAVAFAIAVGAGLMAAPGASASRTVEVAGAHFPSAFLVDDERLELRGAAPLRWRRLVKAYVAALYLPPHTPHRDALDNVPKRLEIEYFWGIDAPELGRAADRLLRESLGEEALVPLRARLDELHASYEPVEPGDRYALTYRPDAGTELSKNGRPLVVIPGTDFAAAYFSMWLGESPIDEDLRDRLLGTLSTRAKE